MATRPRTPTLDRFLGLSPELAALSVHAARLARLQDIYTRCVPPHLLESSNVANLKLETLIVHAANAAVATKLKQLVPRLRAEFLRAGFELTDIQCKVQPLRPEPAPWKSDRDAHVSDGAKRMLADFGDSLEADSPLRAALKRFVDHTG